MNLNLVRSADVRQKYGKLMTVFGKSSVRFVMPVVCMETQKSKPLRDGTGSRMKIEGINSCSRCGDYRDIEVEVEDRMNVTVNPHEIYRTYRLRCAFCGRKTDEYRDFYEAVQAWNRRANK